MIISTTTKSMDDRIIEKDKNTFINYNSIRYFLINLKIKKNRSILQYF